jgi:hypothetical protein
MSVKDYCHQNLETTTDVSNEYSVALKSFFEVINQQFKAHNIPAEQAKPIEESVKVLAKEEGVQDY